MESRSILLALLFNALMVGTYSLGFKCTSPAKCNSLVTYVSPNTTTLSSIKSLFSIKTLRPIIAVNNLPLSTSASQSVAAKQRIRIPLTCKCKNGSGVSYNKPVYTVKKGDGLYHIAAEVFSGLVSFREIADANNITNINLIEVGQKLHIPLPCSCDTFAGERFVHCGHVVERGASVASIARSYGSSRDAIVKINGIRSSSSLVAGQVLDIPLRACNTSLRGDSLDSKLLIPNNSYSFTANNCVRCMCHAANNWILQCEPSGLRASKWPTCPKMACQALDHEKTLNIGKSRESGCNRTSCAYEGFYANRTILTTLVTEPICSATSSGGRAQKWISFCFFLILSSYQL